VAGVGSAGAAAVCVCERVAGRGRGNGVRADCGVDDGSLAFAVLAGRRSRASGIREVGTGWNAADGGALRELWAAGGSSGNPEGGVAL
jgi:hypothetical protein